MPSSLRSPSYFTALLGDDGFGFISRYSTADTDDGLPGSEGQFLDYSFWLVSALA